MPQTKTAAQVVPTNVNLTCLQPSNFKQTFAILEHAKSGFQQNSAEELFENEEKAEFLYAAEMAYLNNSIFNDFTIALKESTIDAKIGLFHQMQTTYNYSDIYDAIEDVLCYYLWSVKSQIAQFKEAEITKVLQEHYDEAHKTYRELISFTKENKL